MMSRRFATVVTIVIVVAFVVVAVAPAFAAAPASLVQHAGLAASTPRDGSSVETADEVVLEFTEEVDATFVQVGVTGPSGSEASGAPTVAGREVTQALSPDLPPGEHVVTYRVVSTDGHPVTGTVTFATTQAAASAAPSGSGTSEPTPSPTGSGVAAPTVTTVPAGDASGGGSTGWLVVAAVAVLAVLALGAAWRTLGGPPDPARRPEDGGTPPA